jgi:hypothetical protein
MNVGRRNAGQRHNAVDGARFLLNTFVPSTHQKSQMWVNLDDSEISAIVAAVGEGAVANKLLARPWAGTGAFVAAAEKKKKKHFIVEEEGVIERQQFGAWVMCWKWISEKKAGLPTSFEHFYLSDDVAKMLKSIPKFRVEEIEHSHGRLVARGAFSGHSWTFTARSKMWSVVFHRSETCEWLHSEKWSGDAEACEMSQEQALRNIAAAITHASLGPGNRRLLRHSLSWRRHVEQCMFGEIPKEHAHIFMGGTLEELEADVKRHRLAMLELDASGNRFWGPVCPDADLG